MTDASLTSPPAEPRRPSRARAFPTVRSVLALILREMSTRYGRSPGGYLWALLEPLGSIVILSLAFSLLMRHPPLGTDFVLFYATGYLPFSMYNRISQVTSRALTFSSSLLVYPVVLWIDAVIARVVLNVLTALLIAYILLTGIVLVTGSQIALRPGPVLCSFALAALVGIAVGLMNCVLNGFFAVWSTIWGIITRPLFLASGVILLYESLPRVVQNILWWNPLYHVTGMMRSGIYPMYRPDYVSPVYVLSVALPLIVLGLVLVQRYHKDILNH